MTLSLLRKTAIGLAAFVVVMVPSMGSTPATRPNDRDLSVAADQIGSGLPDDLGTASATTEPAPEVPDANPTNQLVPADEPAPPATVMTNPVPTDENGNPMFLSQDGGDGEHASIAVSQGVRNLIQSGDYDVWGLNFGETHLSNETETVFYLKSGDTWFRVTVTPDASVAPDGQ
jgi:hypothetical protein